MVAFVGKRRVVVAPSAPSAPFRPSFALPPKQQAGRDEGRQRSQTAKRGLATSATAEV